MIHSGKLLFQIRKRTLLIHIKNKTYRNFVILCFCSIYISLPPPHRIRKMNSGRISAHVCTDILPLFCIIINKVLASSQPHTSIGRHNLVFVRPPLYLDSRYILQHFLITYLPSTNLWVPPDNHAGGVWCAGISLQGFGHWTFGDFVWFLPQWPDAPISLSQWGLSRVVNGFRSMRAVFRLKSASRLSSNILYILE